MIYPVVVFGHPVLRKVASDITAEYEGLSDLISDMFDTMYRADGVGLAAPQIGKSIRLFIIDADPLKEDYPELAGFKKVFINAEIIDREGKEVTLSEGCLSLPSIREDVKRPSVVKMRYYDEEFILHEVEYTGFAARVIQHEYDHIDGKLFIDYLNPLKKRLLKGKLNNISKGKVNLGYKIKTAL